MGWWCNTTERALPVPWIVIYKLESTVISFHSLHGKRSGFILGPELKMDEYTLKWTIVVICAVNQIHLLDATRRIKCCLERGLYVVPGEFVKCARNANAGGVCRGGFVRHDGVYIRYVSKCVWVF